MRSSPVAGPTAEPRTPRVAEAAAPVAPSPRPVRRTNTNRVNRIDSAPMPLPSIAEAGRLFRTGELDPRRLVEICLRQIDALEPQVRAWVVVDRDGARRAADAAAARLQGNDALGPLHGIPLAIKDIVDVAGFPTLAGARVRSTEPVAN